MKVSAAQKRVKRIQSLIHEHFVLRALIKSTEELSKKPNYDMDTSYLPNYRRRLESIEKAFDEIFNVHEK
ncbi:MAG: hypothetical protein WCX48_09790 [Bacteroidales bacterium]